MCVCRLVADLAAQLIALGPWKIVYNQLEQLNPAWFQQHAIHYPEQPVGLGRLFFPLMHSLLSAALGA